jgi:ubiquinone/menaquinone biosynthesis C-methylase UbiE
MESQPGGDLILGLDHVQVTAPRDGEDRARWFYGAVLGLRELPKPAALAGRGGVWYRCGDRALHIGLEDEFRPARKAHPAFLVRDLAAIEAQLAAAGMATRRDAQIPGYERFETRDPFGNRLEFMQRVGAPATPDDGAAEAVKARARAQFARTAPAYVASQGHARGDDLRRLVELAAPQPSDRALDVSTGGGHTALALAPQVARVVASDLTPAMLAAARAFLTSQGVTNADYVIADAERLPFLDAAFDLVTVRIAPHHYADARAACGELARVLVPGGRLVLIDNVAPDDPALDAFMNDIEWRRDQSHVRNYTAPEWHQMLAEAGLSVTHTELDRKVHDFASWTARSEMPEGDRAALERDLRAATPAARAHFAIVVEGERVISWSSDFIIIAAIKPGPAPSPAGAARRGRRAR